MKEFFAIISVVTAIGFVLLLQEVFADSKLRLCHEIECPQEAVSCTKAFKASEDNTKLITKYFCDGEDGRILMEKVNEEANKDPAKIHQPYAITKKFLVI